MIYKIKEAIGEILNKKGSCIVAIDGRCGSGKTTIAKILEKELDCNVFHMDDFFLRKEQRSEERIAAPGENVDHERFLSEVLIPLKNGESFFYRPYQCSIQDFGKEICVPYKKISIIEGSYSCHENLWKHYDLRIFSDVDKALQMERIINREGEEKAKAFKEKWIPMEEKYFEKFSIKERCDIVVGN